MSPQRGQLNGDILTCESGQRYQLKEVVGRSARCEVRMALNTENQTEVACKIVARASSTRPEVMMREVPPHQLGIGAKSPRVLGVMCQVAVMKALQHPNILKLVEACEDEKHYFVVMELASNGQNHVSLPPSLPPSIPRCCLSDHRHCRQLCTFCAALVPSP